MARSDPGSTDRFRDPVQKPVSNITCTGLGGQPAFSAEGRHFKLFDGSGDAELFRKLLDKKRFLFGFFSAEHVIEVSHVKCQAEVLRKCLQDAEEADRIWAARDGHDHAVAWVQHAESVDSLFNFYE
jgi:hypothetical protein